VENFDIYTKIGTKRIIFHIEAVGDLERFRDFIEGIDIYIRDILEIGVAINLTTELRQIVPFINHIDFVQCMGIEKIGFQKQIFDERVLEKVKWLKEKFPDLIISVDGGVDLDTALVLLGVGVSRLVSGSAIFNNHDILATIEKFRVL
jgi:ribulose-phosphate 3-epimerase